VPDPDPGANTVGLPDLSFFAIWGIVGVGIGVAVALSRSGASRDPLVRGVARLLGPRKARDPNASPRDIAPSFRGTIRCIILARNERNLIVSFSVPLPDTGLRMLSGMWAKLSDRPLDHDRGVCGGVPDVLCELPQVCHGSRAASCARERASDS